MAATVSGSKTVNNSVSPNLTASTLTTLLATPIENLTIAQFRQIADALTRVAKGGDANQTIGALLV